MTDLAAEGAGFDKSSVKKILVVRNDNLGDVICTTPALRALRETFPKAFIGVLVADYTKEALTGLPFIDRVYSYEKAKHSKSGRLASWYRQGMVIGEIRRERFDVAIGIRSRFTKSHAWLVFASGAPKRVGHRPTGGGGSVSSSYYNIFVPDETEELHEVERSLNVVRGVGADTRSKRLSMHIPSEALSGANAFIAENNLLSKDSNKLVTLHITSRPEHNRVWPVESYVKVVDGLMATPGVDLVMNWMKKDASTATEVMENVLVRPRVFEASSLKGFAAFLSRSDLLITLEGGSMHIGAAAGAPTLAIFGDTSTVVWRPWGEGNVTLKRGALASLVTADDVLKAARAMLAGRKVPDLEVK